MKKVVTVLAVVFGLAIFTSCTDESTELEERIEFENKLQLIDKSDVDESPDTRRD